MSGFLRAIAPGVALGGVALGVVAGFDAAVHPSAAAPPDRSPTATGGATAGCETARTITGDTVQTRWGPVQVQITVSSGEITSIDVLQYPADDRKSVSINERALPTLIQEALTAQSADVDTVSGATYTSDSYRTSLQDAIDQARAAATAG